ncbi:MAG: hypothetical protein LKJ88_05920 [Bacilli bacterium]|jgi:hypothetical protein|nr:hypothetical protein [Bacilli bacterium]
MIILLDSKKEEAEAKQKKDRFLSLFVLVSFLVLTGLTLGIIYSPEDYLLLEIVMILLLTIYLWLTIYFFSSPYRALKKRYLFFLESKEGIKEEEEVEVLGLEKDQTLTKDGLTAYLLKGQIKEKDKVYPRDIYLLTEEDNLLPGMKIKAVTFNNVLFAYEAGR